MNNRRFELVEPFCLIHCTESKRESHDCFFLSICDAVMRLKDLGDLAESEFKTFHDFSDSGHTNSSSAVFC